ncbi:MAG: acetyl-CoA decarbonylase/synthase complex subunit gamma, partial [Nitrospirae bacterium]|nr:acetyl-CoA decarbonylase/synthase complex subunit gamma [Nitrospirota bacterium]
MALTGVQIFKLLPKTNCKKCGFPTCLAFAMKLAQRQASLDACPDVSDEAKATLGEASAPPVRPVTLGAGERAVKMGEETVLFRHEKKFVNPPALALEIKDTDSDDIVEAKIQDVL